MRLLLWALALFSVAVVAALALHNNAADLTVFVPPYQIDLSLNLAIIVLMLAFVLGYIVLRSMSALVTLPGQVSRYRRRVAQNAAYATLNQALLAWFAGRTDRARRLSEKALTQVSDPQGRAVATLIQIQTQPRSAGQLEFDATSLPTGDAVAALLLIRSRLALRRGDAHSALELASAATRHAPGLAAAMLLELQARRALEQTDELLPLITRLEKSGHLLPEQSQEWRRQVYFRIFTKKIDNVTTLVRRWKRLSAVQQEDPFLACAVARRLNEWGEFETARDILLCAQEKHWDSRIALIWSEFRHLQTVDEASRKEYRSRLEIAEKWLRQQPHDATLLLTLGRLCRALGLWGKAESYLSASASVQPSVVAHLELARLLSHLEREEEAQPHFETAASLASDHFSQTDA